MSLSSLRRKIHLMWTLRRDLSAEMDSPWLTEGPNFMDNKSLEAICRQGFSRILYPGKSLRLNPWLPALRPAFFCHLVNPCWETLVSSFYQPTDTCVIQSELHNFDIPHLHKTNVIENLGRKFHYNRLLPFVSVEHNWSCYPNLCLQATTPFAQINAYSSLLQFKISFDFHI